MSERELASWRAYLETGRVKTAAAKLGIHEQTVKRHLDLLKAEYRVKTLAQLAVAIERAEVA